VPPYPSARLPVTLTVAGFPAEILYAGAAPGAVGLLQVKRVSGRLHPHRPGGVELAVGSAVAPTSRSAEVSASRAATNFGAMWGRRSPFVACQSPISRPPLHQPLAFLCVAGRGLSSCRMTNARTERFFLT